VTEEDIKVNIINVVTELGVIGELEINEENIQVLGKSSTSKHYLTNGFRENTSVPCRLSWMPR
jgi:hypothetical protein